MKALIAKSKNRRIEIYLLPQKAFLVKTKHLVELKTRNITITENVYSVETFALMRELFGFFLDNSEVKNKILLKELSEKMHVSVSTNLKIKS